MAASHELLQRLFGRKTGSKLLGQPITFRFWQQRYEEFWGCAKLFATSTIAIIFALNL